MSKKFNRLYAALFSVLIVALASTFVFGFKDAPASAQAIGTRTILEQDANQAVTASTTPVNTDLVTTLAANQRVHIRYSVPFTLAGTASGIKFLVDAPSTPTAFVSSVIIFADDATLGLVSVVTTEGAQGVTLANAGNHTAIIDVTVENGANAGDLNLQFAQNVSDAGAVTILRGATAEVVKF